MKTYLMTVSLVCIATASLVRAQEADYGDEMGQSAMPPPPPQMQSAPIDGDAVVFYESLQPHGTWMQVSPFGPVWRPNVAVRDTAWRPYSSGGRWVWSKNAWAWESEYEWGWAPFHYGRWVTSKGLGWVWIPGRQWAPAWVSWQQTPTQCGWAPMPPDRSAYVGVFNTTDSGFSWGFQFSLTSDHYVYAPQRCFDNVVVVRDWDRHDSYSGRHDYYDNRGDYRSYRNYDSGHRTEYVANRHQERPAAQVTRAPVAVRTPEPSRRTTIMQQVVMRTAPSSTSSSRPAPQVTPRPQPSAPQVRSQPRATAPQVSSGSSSSSSDRRSSRLQDIIARTRK